MKFKVIPYKDAIKFLLPRHYSGRKPQIKWAFGWYDDNNKLRAVCTIGKPASNALCDGICGKENSKYVYELNRLCRDEDLEAPLSQFVAQCLKFLNDVIIVSYSDTAMNHHGYIYQACNFIYTGATKQRTDKYTSSNKHSRHYDNDEQGQYRKVRSSKHRYIYFCGDKRFVKKMKAQLHYPILPYPKGDNSNYVLGEYMRPLLMNDEGESEQGKYIDTYTFKGNSEYIPLF